VSRGEHHGPGGGDAVQLPQSPGLTTRPPALAALRSRRASSYPGVPELEGRARLLFGRFHQTFFADAEGGQPAESKHGASRWRRDEGGGASEAAPALPARAGRPGRAWLLLRCCSASRMQPSLARASSAARPWGRGASWASVAGSAVAARRPKK
jgi:hypothetical protein